jgi:hypothetical protein
MRSWTERLQEVRYGLVTKERWSFLNVVTGVVTVGAVGWNVGRHDCESHQEYSREATQVVRREGVYVSAQRAKRTSSADFVVGREVRARGAGARCGCEARRGVRRDAG